MQPDKIDPPFPAPPGQQWVAAEEGPTWRLQPGRPCRRWLAQPKRVCRAPSAAEINRGAYTNRGRVPRWWAYCPDHLYGRWVEDGQLMVWTLEDVPRRG